MLSLHNPILTILTNVNKCYVITINNSILTINTYSITKSFLFHALYPHAMARLYDITLLPILLMCFIHLIIDCHGYWQQTLYIHSCGINCLQLKSQ